MRKKEDKRRRLLRIIRKADRDLAEGRTRAFEDVVADIEKKLKSKKRCTGR